MKKIQWFWATLMCGALWSGSAVAEEDGWPTPPDGWWKNLKGGESAEFDMQMGPTNMKMVQTVDKIEGSNITFTTQTFMGDNAESEETQTIDAADSLEGGGVAPPGATVEKGGFTQIKVGDTSFDCTIL